MKGSFQGDFDIDIDVDVDIDVGEDVEVDIDSYFSSCKGLSGGTLAVERYNITYPSNMPEDDVGCYIQGPFKSGNLRYHHTGTHGASSMVCSWSLSRRREISRERERETYIYKAEAQTTATL